MIIPVKKILIYGMKEQLDLFFQKAQESGCLEFIKSASYKPSEASEEIRELILALKILRHLPVSSQATEEAFPSLQEAAKRVIFLQKELSRLQEQERRLQAEIAEVAPFGPFSLEEFVDVQKETKRLLQFFKIPSSRRKEKEIPRDLIYIGTEYDLDYFVLISKEKKKFPHMTEVVIEKPLNVVEEEMQQTLWKMRHFSQELESLSSYGKHFQRVLVEKLNQHHLKVAKESAFSALEDHLFMVEAWLPESKKEEFLSLLASFAVDYEEIAVSKEERIPTFLKNKPLGQMGEDLVKIYDIPSIEDRDPSPWVLFFFVLFFAMIICDAGYGLVYLAIALFLQWKGWGKEGFTKRFRHLLFTLSFACIGYGVISGSFFGIELPPSSSLSPYLLVDKMAEKKADYHVQKKDDVYQFWVAKYPRLSDVKNGKEFLLGAFEKEKGGSLRYDAFSTFKKNILLEFSLLVGAFHISISLLRYSFRNWPAIGWVLFIIGGYLFFPSILHSTSLLVFMGWISKDFAYHIGPYLLYSGLGLALVLALIEKKLAGWEEVTKSVQLFSDILSYLRLYALGVASAMLASTFNMLGGNLPLYVGWFVILLGHLINFQIGIMGGVIHGLRLNFIEAYHYSFIGDGKLFQPLKLLK